MAGKPEVKVTISGDAKGATKATAEAEASLGKLGKTAGILGKTIDDKLGQSALGSKLGKSFGSFEQAGTKAFTNLGGGASKFGGLLGPAVAGGAIAAGAAIGKFALDGARNFENLALQAGQFATATGLSTLEAGRFIEVAKDLKIDPSTFETAFVKMEKGIASNRAAFGNLVVTAKNGSTDLTATFLNVVKHLQGIKDPIDRAQESAKLFGKGFTGIAEILGTSADDLTKRLGAVANVKVITPEQVQAAKDYRDALDKFHDSVEEAGLSLGQALLPGLTRVADAAAQAIPIMEALGKAATTALGKPTQQQKSNVSRFFDDLAHANIKGITQDLIGYGNQATVTSKIEAFNPQQIEVAAGLTTKAQLYAAAQDKANASAAASVGYFEKLGSVNDRYADSAAGAAAQTRAAADEMDRQNQIAQDLFTSEENLLGIVTSTARAQQDFVKGTQAINKAELAAAKGGKDHAKAVDDLNGAYLDQIDNAGRIAKQNVDNAITQGKLTKKTVDADTQTKIYADTLRFLATKQAPAVALQLLGVANQMEGLGKQKPKPTLDLNKASFDGKAADAQRKADGLDHLRPKPVVNLVDNASKKASGIQGTINSLRGKTVTIDANTTAARNALNGFINANQNRFITVQVHTATGVSGIHQQHGGPVSAGHSYIVGEAGQELFVPNVSGRIIPHNALTSGRSGGLMGGTTVNITVNGALDPVSTAKQIKAILAKGERAGVR